RTVAVIGQLGDTLMEDWYSGTLPYAVTARAGLAERCESVVFCEGVDRVTMSAEAGHVVADPAGGPLSLGPEPGGFDVFDWGGAAYALRPAATGRFVSVEDGVLVNDQPGPNGWEVRQTFRMEERPRGSVALRHISSGCYVGAVDGVLRLVDDADQALWLELNVVSSGAERAAELAAKADVAVVVV